MTDVNLSVGDDWDIRTLEFSRDGSALYGAHQELFTVDIDTGVATRVGDGGGITDIQGMAFVGSDVALPCVPEPAAIVMLIPGLLQAGSRRRKGSGSRAPRNGRSRFEWSSADD